MIFHPNISTIISLFTLYRSGSPSVSIQLSLHPKLYESIWAIYTSTYICCVTSGTLTSFFWFIRSHLGVLAQVKYKSPSFILRVIQRKCGKKHTHTRHERFLQTDENHWIISARITFFNKHSVQFNRIRHEERTRGKMNVQSIINTWTK